MKKCVISMIPVLLLLASGFAQIAVSPASLDFGTQMVNTTSASKVVWVTNKQTTAVTITKVVTGAEYAQWSNCVTTLAPSHSCYIRVTFTPTAAGASNNGVTITDNASNNPQKVATKGTGVLPALSLSPIEVVFASQTTGNTSGSQAVTLTNNSKSAITITGLAVSGPAAQDFSVPSACTGQLAAGSTCQVNATFDPTAGGVRTAILTVNSSAGSQTATLIGPATTGAVSLAPKSLTFTSQQVQTTSQSKPVTITNSGGSSMDIVSIIASGDFEQTNDCPASLAAGTNCTVSVTFSPSASGSRTGYLTITDTGNGDLQTVDLSGTATAPTSTVVVTPHVASLTRTQEQQFTATVNGVASNNVDWLVDGVVGGTPTAGSISATGLYGPPHAPGVHVVAAQSKADSSQRASVPVTITNFPGTFTFQNDTFRSGQNTHETVLTTGNVNANQFGKLFSYPVDGYIYAQPLYVPNVSIANKGTHNVTYVATEHDSVYAFDADGLAANPLWHVSFIDSGSGVTSIPGADVNMDGCESIGPEVGITSTPVIDSVHGVMYIVARTKELSGSNANYVQRLHALDITTGAEMPNSPVEITGTIPGVGAGNISGTISFNSRYQNQRAALLLSNGIVYIGWASLCDYGPYHGWLLGYDSSSLKQVVSYISSPNGLRAGVWQSGGGLAADGNGNVYFVTGNGTFDADSGGADYGDSYIKLTVNGGALQVADYFTPYTQAILGGALDLDLGSGGPLLVPNNATKPNQLMLNTGKDGNLYLVDRNNMGKFRPTDNNQIVETISGATAKGNWGKPAYWNMQVYVWGLGDVLKAFTLDQDLLSLTPTTQSTEVSGYPSPTPTVSANANANGIVWAVRTALWKSGGPAELYAYDGANVSRNIYISTTNSKRDQAGPAVRFAIPTVANGKVYVGTQTEVDVYGLLP